MNTPVITLSSVRAVVEALGGTGPAAAALGVGASTISNWLAWGYFPDRASTLVAVRDACATRGFAVDEGLFVSRIIHDQTQPSTASP